MPTLVRTNQTKADLLQRKLEINSELRELRNRYDKPGVVEVPGDRQRVDDLIARHTPGDAWCFRDQRDHVHRCDTARLERSRPF